MRPQNGAAGTPGFAATVATLTAFNSRLQQADDALHAERERIAQCLVQSRGPLPTDFDPERHRLCEAMLGEAEQCESVAAVRTLPRFREFEQAFAVPRRLIDPPKRMLDTTQEDLASLLKYLASAARGASEAAAAERAASKALAEARSAADASPELNAAAAAAGASRRAAIAESVGALARSDHLPIRAVATLGGGRAAVRVSSWNVQEHVHDGLSTCALHCTCANPWLTPPAPGACS